MSFPTGTPYLSIVIAGRNDNYGGDFEERMAKCVKWLGLMLQQWPIDTEVLVVNYNPDNSRPALNEVLPLNFNLRNVAVRYITVSAETHAQYVKLNKVKPLPFLEYAAKNVGIYRAQGEYILCINPDIIIAPETFELIYKKQLNPNAFYRADRFDHYKVDVADKSNYIKKATAASFRMFMLAHIVPFTISNTLLLSIFRSLNKVYATIRLYYYYYFSLIFPFFFPKPYVRPEMRWHCNASGDFMLMHHSKWKALNGYEETKYLPLHVDALLVVKAAVYGLKQEILNQPVYHQHHERRFDTANENTEMRIAYEVFYDDCYNMMSKGLRSDFFKNNENWGLSSYTLSEINIS